MRVPARCRADAGPCPARLRNSTIGRSGDASSAASPAVEFGKQARRRTCSATITANGFSSRALRARSARHRRRIACIADEVEAAQTLDCDDLAAPQSRDRRLQRIIYHHLGAVRVEQAQRRPARRASVGFRMETAIRRRHVFAMAIRAQRERRHAGPRPVIGQFARDRVARTAVRAIDEGIAVAAIGRREELVQAIRTGRAVGSDGCRHVAAATFEDRESRRIPAQCAVARFDTVDPRLRRRLGSAVASHMRLMRPALPSTSIVTPLASLPYPAIETELLGQAVDKRAESYALDDATHIDAPPHGRRCRGRHFRCHACRSRCRAFACLFAATAPCSNQSSQASHAFAGRRRKLQHLIPGLTRGAHTRWPRRHRSRDSGRQIELVDQHQVARHGTCPDISAACPRPRSPKGSRPCAPRPGRTPPGRPDCRRSR